MKTCRKQMILHHKPGEIVSSSDCEVLLVVQDHTVATLESEAICSHNSTQHPSADTV